MRRRSFYKSLAVLMAVTLLAGQYSFSARAETAGSISAGDAGRAETAGSISAGDAGRAETAGSISAGDAGRAEFAGSVSGSDVADEFTIDGIRYRIMSSAGVELVKADSAALSQNVVIPVGVEGPDHREYEVVSIREDAFTGCGMVSMQIPDSVTSIGSGAFAECESLESIRIPGGVRSIGYYTFWNCRKLKSVQLQEGIAAIEVGAFGNCESLESILIPGSVSSIGQQAFYECKSLKSVFLQNGIADIGIRAFCGCSSLKDVRLSDTIIKIGQSAFEGCGSLESIQIPNSVEEIGSSAFYRCKSLNSVQIPEGITRIENWVFGECGNLENIEIPQSVTVIGQGAFFSCAGLKDIQLPDQLARIEDKAFCGCDGLESIEIPGSVEYIGKAAFSACNHIHSFRIAVKTEETDGRKWVKPLSVDEDAFANLVPDNSRKIVFLTEDGAAELSDTSSPALAEAWEAYRNVNDGDPGDNYWYGWYLGEAPAVEVNPVYSVTVRVYIDNEECSVHDRIFMLYREDLAVSDLTRVSSGTYEIYDVSGAPGRAAGMPGLNTGVTVEVNGKDAIARVDYYTVTFYDGDTAYDMDSSQRPQVILKGYPVSRPDDPVKEGVVFQRWVAGPLETAAYDFNRKIQEKTALYAVWTEKEPDTPEAPDKPGEGDKPEVPDKPGEGDKLEAPDKPGEGDKPEEPGSPEAPDKPGESGIPGGPQAPIAGDMWATGSGAENNSSSYSAENNNPSGSREPETGDTTQVQVYATIAMIAGLLYLLLYFADSDHGMTEEKKESLVSALIGWAKRGGCLRRYAAIAAIFCLLCYYHGIGKPRGFRGSARSLR